MTSEVEERPRLVTAGYGQHRSQWVKNKNKKLTISTEITIYEWIVYRNKDVSIKSEQLFLYNRLSWSFDLAVALIFTPVTNLLLDWWIVSTTGQFTRNIKDPPNLISHNRCYGLQPCYHVSYPRCNHFSDFLWRFQNKCVFKLPFTKIYLSIRKLLFHVFIIGDWCPMVSRSIVKYQLVQILFNHLRKKIQLINVRHNGIHYVVCSKDCIASQNISDHSDENYCAVFWCGIVHYALKGGSNYLIRYWNPSVWPFKWKPSSSTFMSYCLVHCETHSCAWPFKREHFDTFMYDAVCFF